MDYDEARAPNPNNAATFSALSKHINEYMSATQNYLEKMNDDLPRKKIQAEMCLLQCMYDRLTKYEEDRIIMSEELKQTKSQLLTLEQKVNSTKESAPPPPPSNSTNHSTYAEIARKQLDLTAKAQFENDLELKKRSLFLPRLSPILGPALINEQALDGATNKPAPSSVLIQPLHHYIATKAANLDKGKNVTFYSNFPTTPLTTIKKLTLIPIKNNRSEFSACVEFYTPQIKCLAARILRHNSLPGYDTTPCSDARLKIRKNTVDFNATTSVLGALLSQAKKDQMITSYDLEGFWTHTGPAVGVTFKKQRGKFPSHRLVNPGDLMAQQPSDANKTPWIEALTKTFTDLGLFPPTWNKLANTCKSTVTNIIQTHRERISNNRGTRKTQPINNE